MNNSKVLTLTVSVVWLRLKCVVALVALLAGVATAQTSTTYSSTDGKTPSGMQAGNSAGSYALSGFDSISPFSGSLSFRLPLLSIGGRGGAGYTMMLPIERKWRVEHTIVDPNLYCQHCETYEVTHTYSPNDQPWGATPSYGAGILQGRRAGKESIACGTSKVYSETLTRLTFITPEGTEYELRDQLYGGKPLPAQLPCGSSPSRGTVFVTADGTSATFVSDAPILDYSNTNDYPPFYPSGHLLMRDGTRYRINGGQVEWIQDRQGNRVTIGAVGSQTQITDSLGRITTVSYANLPSVPYDEITFAGVGGVPRRIRVYYASLSSHLRAGYSIRTYNSLFAGLGGSNHSNYDPPVVSSVELPDGRAYHFWYNSHGELARVELPTGGAYEYDFQSSDGVIDLGAQSHDTFGLVHEYEIYRRVERKRVYGTGGALESQTWFTLADGSTYDNTVAQVTTYNAGGALLAAEKHYYYGSAYPYLNTYTKPTHYAAWGEGKQYKTETLAADGLTVLRRSEETWQQRAPVSWWNINYGPEPANDPRVTQSLTTLADSNQVTKQTFAYDAFNNRTDVWEYDYGTGTPPPHPTRRTHTDYLTTNLINNVSVDYTSHTGVHLRSLPWAQQVYAVNTSTGAQSPTPIAQSETRYDEYALLDCDGVGCGGTVQWVDPGAARGNATTARRWLDTNNTWLESRVEYDQLGNVRMTWEPGMNKTDPKRATQIEYSAAYKHAYPTHTKSPVPDPTDNRASNTSLQTWTAYDFATGKVTSTTDANGQITHLRYTNDSSVTNPLDRLRRVEYPDGGVTRYNYSDTKDDLYTQTISYMGPNQTSPVESRQYFDALGRPTRNFLYDGADSTPWTVTDTHYDALGRVWKTSNPYRVSAPSPALPSPSACTTCTSTSYDALGRVTTVTTPDNAVVTSDYSGVQVTVTDQKGKARRSVSDALGRLTQVVEAPEVTSCQPDGAGCATNYTYDALGNLRKVDQGGQLRYFMYDSLSRLIRARNPEQAVNATLALQDSFKAPEDTLPNSLWTLKYTYDANGNLATKTDARGITTTHEYDNLNRLIQTSYTGGTAYTLRTYDKAQPNGRGRYYADYESSTTGTLNYVMAYDAMGRPTEGKTEFHLEGSGWRPAYTYSRLYDKMGHVTRQTYPSGHTAHYSQFDAAGRLKQFTGNLGDGTQRTYSTGIEYDEAGRMKLEQFGTETALSHKRGYNVRGQMCEVGLGTPGTSNRGLLLFYYSQVNGYSGCASGPDNNGNIALAQHWVPNDPQAGGWQWFNQSYTYDSLNRIGSVREEQNAQTTTGEQHFTYDRWGNRQINAAATYNNNNPSLPFNEKQFDARDLANTNRLYAPGDMDAGKPDSQRLMRYDPAGNLIEDSYTGAGARTYDAENRMTSATTGINSSSFYTYDAAGKRVRRQNSNESAVWQVYGFEGELLAEYTANAAPASPQKEYGYRGGELLVTAEGATAARPVGWMNAVNVVAGSGGNLSKPSGGASDWNAGAMSTRAIASGDGYVEFSAPENNTARMIGLSHGDSHQSYTDIDFALYPYSDGNMYVYEQGGYVTNLGPYAAGDRYRVSMEGGAIKYRKNGTIVYSSARAAHYPLLADTSFYTPGASLGGVVMAGRQVENVGWTNAVGVTAAGNNLSKAGADGWTSGAISQASIAAGDGYVEYTAAETNKSRMLGLSHGDSGQSYTDIDFALYAYSDSTLHAYEGGVYAGYLGTYAAGDRLRVAVEGGQVRYLRNGVVVGVSNSAVTYPLVADAALYHTGASLTNVVMSGTGQSAGGAMQWLVSDHLGTPRMVVDQTGNLAGIKRHDYLPFGEEIGAGVGGRNTNQGYVTDNVRQQFTGHERDDETGLDYMQARYFMSVQGRFTSCDPITLSKNHIVNPQRWNLYVYVNNNPLALIDPDGRNPQGKDGSKTIDVFLTFTPDKMKYAGDWSKVKKTASDAGYRVVVHQPGDLTEENVKNSLANSKAVVFVGDSEGILANGTSGRFTATDIALAGGVYITNNGLGRNMPTINTDVVTGESVMTTEMVSLKPQNNTMVTGIFVCGGNDIASGLNGTTVVANNGGPDGYTSATAITSSAQEFVSVLATTNNVTTATTAAQRVLSTSRVSGHDTIITSTGTRRIPYNDRGDRLITSGRNN